MRRQLQGSLSGRSSAASLEWSLLAAAVVRQAMLDASSPTSPRALRADAQRFLAGDADYRFWAAIAGEATH